MKLDGPLLSEIEEVSDWFTGEGMPYRAAVCAASKSEIGRLRAVLRAIMQLDGQNDLPDAWTLARAALEEQM